MITDQPGRLFAILFFSPYLIYCGIKYNDIILIILGILLFLYECFWICTSGPQVTFLK